MTTAAQITDRVLARHVKTEFSDLPPMAMRNLAAMYAKINIYLTEQTIKDDAAIRRLLTVRNFCEVYITHTGDCQPRTLADICRVMRRAYTALSDAKHDAMAQTLGAHFAAVIEALK